jgi:RNA polymerase sigma factor (sigma-70 family)
VDERRQFDRLWALLNRSAQRWGASREQAQDVAAEALADAWSRFREVDLVRHEGWILTAARHRFFNARRRRQEVALDDESPVIDRTLAKEAKALADYLDQVRHELPDKDCDTLRLALQGLPTEAIARLRGISQRAVQLSLARIRTVLGRALDRE